jgi:TRAP transporter TAXI family solute receptor
VRVDSDIKSAGDFKGRPFPTEFTQQSIVKFTTEAMLATGGVGWDDVKPVPVVNFAKGIELLAARRVDGANGAPGSAIIQEANARTPIKFIPIERSPANQAIMDRIVPGAAFADLDPAPYMPEIRETVTMLGFPFMLVTGTHVSDETIYKVTKALYEAKADLIAQHGVFRSFDPKKMAVDAADLKYHPGAVKFYADNGLWPPAKH